MEEFTVDTVRPSDFEIKGGLCGSSLNNCEREIIARNIIVLSLKNDDSWFGFTWEEYQKRCTHEVTGAGREVLDDLVKRHYLKYEDERYYVQDNFIAALSEFIRK